jgi:pyruvate,orthophosphate dikinase
LDDSSMSKLATGLGATPGVVVGHAYFTADDAQQAAENGEDVIMVTYETSPDDVHGMKASVGILTATGGLVSHAAVVARGWGKPCVVGCSDVSITPNGAVINGKQISAGDLVKIDGTTGDVFA